MIEYFNSLILQVSDYSQPSDYSSTERLEIGQDLRNVSG